MTPKRIVILNEVKDLSENPPSLHLHLDFFFLRLFRLGQMEHLFESARNMPSIGIVKSAKFRGRDRFSLHPCDFARLFFSSVQKTNMVLLAAAEISLMVRVRPWHVSCFPQN
jgi:hypothetical protein